MNSAVVLIAAFLMTPLIAAPPAIGVVTASGHFTVDRARVWGNATLFSGSKIETDAASSQATLTSGVRVQLAANSSASILDNRLTLWTGAGQVTAADPYEISTGGLAIHPVGAGARVYVSRGAGGTVEVASLSGEARVVAARDGLLLASLPAGRRMNFAMQAAAGALTRTGCLVSKDGRYLLQDQDTQEVIEVTGTIAGLATNAGNRVTVTGTASGARPSINIASSVLNAATVATQSQGGCLSVAAALDARTQPAASQAAAPSPSSSKPAAAPAGGSPAPGGGGGMSTGAKVAIVGVAVGGGAGAAVALSSKKSTSP